MITRFSYTELKGNVVNVLLMRTYLDHFFILC